MFRVSPIVLALAALTAAPAHAAEMFGGVFVHDIDSPLTRSGVERGVDVQLGWRGDRIGRTPLQPYVLASANSAGRTHFAAVGLSAKFGDRVYVRPGVGLAVHTGSASDADDPANRRIEFGSRFLFEPELGLGLQVNDRLSVEASWVHLSHAQLFGRQNPGIDNVGVRLNLRM